MKKKLTLFGILVIAAFSFSAEVRAQQVYCAEFTNMEREVNARLPQKVDEVTELIQVRVNCEMRSISYIMLLSVDENGMAQGWRERKARQHHQLHCNAGGLASQFRWTARTLLYTSSVPPRLLLEFITNPKDCT